MTRRYFLTTSGVRLPLKLVNEIEANSLANRNTYIKADYDRDGRLLRFAKIVYGDIELTHVYNYDAKGALRRAEIALPDEDPVVMEFG